MKPTLSSCGGVPVETIHHCVQAAFADDLAPMKLSVPSGEVLWVLNLDSRDRSSRGFFKARGARASTLQTKMVLSLL